MAKKTRAPWMTDKQHKLRAGVQAWWPSISAVVSVVSVDRKKGTADVEQKIVGGDWDGHVNRWTLKISDLQTLDAPPTRYNPVASSQNNPKLTAAERGALKDSDFADPEHRRFPIHDKAHAIAAVPKLNLWFKRGKITEAEYRTYYARMMKAYNRFGISAHEPPLVSGLRVVAGQKKRSKQSTRKIAVGENPAPRRHLPVLQPYSPEFCERRAASVARPNPAAPAQRNDPAAMRAIMMKAMARPNPALQQSDPALTLKMTVAKAGIEAASVGKNISSLDPMDYYEAFASQVGDPDAAIAALEDMASWGVTDEI